MRKASGWNHESKSKLCYTVPWWTRPIVAPVWLCCAVVMLVVIVFVFTAKVSVFILDEIARTLHAFATLGESKR